MWTNGLAIGSGQYVGGVVLCPPKDAQTTRGDSGNKHHCQAYDNCQVGLKKAFTRMQGKVRICSFQICPGDTDGMS